MIPLSTIPSVNYSFFQCMSRQPDMVKKEGIFNPLLPLSRKAQLMCLLLWIIWTRRYLQTRWLLMSLCNLCQCIEGGDKQSLRRRKLWRWEDRMSGRGECISNAFQLWQSRWCQGGLKKKRLRFLRRRQRWTMSRYIHCLLSTILHLQEDAEKEGSENPDLRQSPEQACRGVNIGTEFLHRETSPDNQLEMDLN